MSTGLPNLPKVLHFDININHVKLIEISQHQKMNLFLSSPPVGMKAICSLFSLPRCSTYVKMFFCFIPFMWDSREIKENTNLLKGFYGPWIHFRYLVDSKFKMMVLKGNNFRFVKESDLESRKCYFQNFRICQYIKKNFNNARKFKFILFFYQLLRYDDVHFLRIRILFLLIIWTPDIQI